MPGKEQPGRVLPADIYDSMELSALAYGGIGAGMWYDFRDPNVPPCCAIGHATDLSVLVEGYLRRAGIDESLSDLCVVAVSSRKRAKNGRISFADWCQWLNVHRGQ